MDANTPQVQTEISGSQTLIVSVYHGITRKEKLLCSGTSGPFDLWLLLQLHVALLLRVPFISFTLLLHPFLQRTRARTVKK
jgi:hypothetical protein